MRCLICFCIFLICSTLIFAQAAPAPVQAAAPAPVLQSAPAPVQAPEPPPVTRTLLEIKKVYMLPMRGGFDQRLANHLTSNKTFEIVTDSKLADAVITDNIGGEFQTKMRELYPSKPKAADNAGGEDSDENAAEPAKPDNTYVPPVSTFSRGRGTIFLVDARTFSVIWSVYMPPKNSSDAEVEKAAQRAADAVAFSFKPAKPKSGLAAWFR